MNVPFFKNGPIKHKPDFIQEFTNIKILSDVSQTPLLSGSMPCLVITGGITADHPLLKVGNKKFGSKKQGKQTNK